MKTKLTALFLILIFSASCTSECKINSEIAEIPMGFQVVRFDQQFAETTPESLPKLQRAFPEFFPKQIPDSVWYAKLQDTIQMELNVEVEKTFPDFLEETEGLRQLFQHVKYYFPEFEAPEVVTVISEVDYRNRVILANDKLLIGLDNYLGSDHKFYVGIQQYLKDDFRRQQIVPNVAQQYASRYVSSPENRTFLAYAVYYGKQLYLLDKFLPCTEDANKIGYSDEEMQFAKENEDQIWRYFVERELLYETDNKLQERFLNEGPFSKFYLQLDNETPAKLGQYIGWQIVRQYVDKNDVSLKKMLITDAKTIFNESNYKPKK